MEDKMTKYRTLEEIYKVAGEEAYTIMLPGEKVKTLVDLAAALFGEENIVSFFNKQYPDLNNKTPYELCEEGKEGCELLEVKLMDSITRLKVGNFKR